VRHDKLSGPWLRRRIDRMLADENMQTAARRLGDAIRKENGAASAVEKIEGAVMRVASTS
jgi:UDP:flavonoid glycosyltransferase YjiC (YdhE family)